MNNTSHLLPYTACLTLTGPDTVTLLERIVTCRVDDMTDNQTRVGALLTPQGKVITDFLLTRTLTGCILVVHENAATNFEKRLKMFRLRADVKIERTDLPRGVLDHGARIAAQLPAFDTDFETASVFPTDINLDQRGGIDYKKGCFVGQEVVSRMKRRGKIRKRTVALMSQGGALAKGDAVLAGEKRLGYITSAHKKTALAILRIDHLATAIAGAAPLRAGQDTKLEAIMPDWLKQEMEAFSNADT